MNSFKKLTCVVLFGLLFCNSKCFCSKRISLPLTCIHSVNSTSWYIVNHCWSEGDVRLPLLLISTAKERIVSKTTLWFQRKKLIVIFGTEKASSFYWLWIWQHIKSVHLECPRTKEPYVGPISNCQITPVFLQFWRVWCYIFRSLSPLFLYFWSRKALDTLLLTFKDKILNFMFDFQNKPAEIVHCQLSLQIQIETE